MDSREKRFTGSGHGLVKLNVESHVTFRVGGHKKVSIVSLKLDVDLTFGDEISLPKLGPR